MKQRRMTWRVYKSVLEGRWGKSHPRKGWREGGKGGFVWKWLGHLAGMCEHINRNEWRQIVFRT